MENTIIWWVTLLSGQQITPPGQNDNNILSVETWEENTLIYEIYSWVNLSWNKSETYGYYIVNRWGENLKIPIKIQLEAGRYSLELWNSKSLVDEIWFPEGLKNLYQKEILSQPPFMIRETIKNISSQVNEKI